MENLAKFGNTVNCVLEIYNRGKLSDVAMAIWIAAMDAEGITCDQACAAMLKYSTNPDNKFAPVPADIVAAVKGGGKSDIEAEAAVEFANMLAGIRKAGIYNDAVFCNHRTNMAIHILGGWRFVCGYEEWGEYIGRKMFIDAYKAVCARPVAMALPLTGIADSRNVYKFGRTATEVAECNRLLEVYQSERLPIIPINPKTIRGAV